MDVPILAEEISVKSAELQALGNGGRFLPMFQMDSKSMFLLAFLK